MTWIRKKNIYAALIVFVPAVVNVVTSAAVIVGGVAGVTLKFAGTVTIVGVPAMAVPFAENTKTPAPAVGPAPLLAGAITVAVSVTGVAVVALATLAATVAVVAALATVKLRVA